MSDATTQPNADAPVTAPEAAIVERLDANDLDGAVGAAKMAVKQKPADATAREWLFNLLALTGQWESAYRQAQTVGRLDLTRANDSAAWCVAIACEQHRIAVWQGKTQPMVIGEPTAWVGKLVAALRQVADGHVDRAAALHDEAADEAASVTDVASTSGTVAVDLGGDVPEDSRFSDWSDADPRLGPIWEAFVDGRYAWIPPGRIVEVVTQAPQSVRDLVWQPAVVRWSAGGTTGVLMPTRYFGTDTAGDPQLIRASGTEFRPTGKDGPYFGLGQRLFTGTDPDDPDSGDRYWPLLQVRSVRFELADQLPPESQEEADDA